MVEVRTAAPPTDPAIEAVFGGERMECGDVLDVPSSVEKYNKEHDERGRFSESLGGSGAPSTSPDKPNAMERAKRKRDAETERPADIFWRVKTPAEVAPTQAEAEGVDGKVHLKRCYDRAGRYVLDRPGDAPGVAVVHGTITIGQNDDGSGGVPIGHAWVEIRRPDGSEVVYDGVQGKFYDRASYYRNTRAADEHRYTATEARRMMLKTRNFGPWERTAGITSGRVRFDDGTPERRDPK